MSWPEQTLLLFMNSEQAPVFLQPATTLSENYADSEINNGDFTVRWWLNKGRAAQAAANV